MYANDTSLKYALESIKRINDSVIDDLYNLKSSLQANILSLNIAKTHWQQESTEIYKLMVEKQSPLSLRVTRIFPL